MTRRTDWGRSDRTVPPFHARQWVFEAASIVAGGTSTTLLVSLNGDTRVPPGHQGVISHALISGHDVTIASTSEGALRWTITRNGLAIPGFLNRVPQGWFTLDPGRSFAGNLTGFPSSECLNGCDYFFDGTTASGSVQTRPYGQPVLAPAWITDSDELRITIAATAGFYLFGVYLGGWLWPIPSDESRTAPV